MSRAAIASPPLALTLGALALGALAAALGLVHAAYQARLTAGQPLRAQAAALERALAAAPWTGPGGRGAKLHMIGFRDCPGCAAYKAAEFPALIAAGADVRVVMFARRDDARAVWSTAPERALVAELALTRDWNLYQAWTATPNAAAFYARGRLPAPAESSRQRAEALEATRRTAEEVMAVFRANGLDANAPLLIWRRGGEWLGASGYSPVLARAIRDDLGAP